VLNKHVFTLMCNFLTPCLGTPAISLARPDLLLLVLLPGAPACCPPRASPQPMLPMCGRCPAAACSLVLHLRIVCSAAQLFRRPGTHPRSRPQVRPPPPPPPPPPPAGGVGGGGGGGVGGGCGVVVVWVGGGGLCGGKGAGGLWIGVDWGAWGRRALRAGPGRWRRSGGVGVWIV